MRDTGTKAVFKSKNAQVRQSVYSGDATKNVARSRAARVPPLEEKVGAITLFQEHQYSVVGDVCGMKNVLRFQMLQLSAQHPSARTVGQITLTK